MFFFFDILNMSIAASVTALFLLLVRFAFERLSIPKKFYNVMWGIFAIRLTLPYSVMSFFSIFNLNFGLSPEKSGETIQMSENIAIAPIQFIDGAIPLENVIYSSSSFSFWLKTAAIIYFAGGSIFIIFYLISFAIAKKKLATCFIIKENEILEECKRSLNFKGKINLYKSSAIDSAIIFGVVKPKIILSDKLDLSDERTIRHILMHELTHIKHLDHLLKLVARITLIAHWFNPVAWICYGLFEKDMEVSCDEFALSKLGIGNKEEYANSIIKLASSQHNFILGNITAFGELSIKSRIVNITKYRVFSRFNSCVVSAFIIFSGIALTTNPIVSAEDYFSPKAQRVSFDTQVVLEDKTKELVKALNADIKPDINTLSTLSGTDASVAEISLAALKEQEFDFTRYRIYPQSETLAYSYLFSDEDCYVCVWERETLDMEFVLDRLFQSETFENIAVVNQRVHPNQEGVNLIKNLHSFGIVDPSLGLAANPKSSIAAFCIDDIRTDLLKQKKLSPDDIYIDSHYIAEDAKRYFNIDGFSYTFDEEIFDAQKQKYIYSEGRGKSNAVDIVDVLSENDRVIITAQTYLDTLHTVVDKSVIYTLYKDR